MAPAAAHRCDIGDVTAHFTSGRIDEYLPMPLGNGDIGGVFDPFGGTYYDELHCGSGPERDIRTLLLTRLVAIDYWCVDGRDPAWHQFDSSWFMLSDPPTHYQAPTAPFTLRLDTPAADLAEHVRDHAQTLTLADAMLRSRWCYRGKQAAVSTWIDPHQSLLIYQTDAEHDLVFEFQEAPTPPRPSADGQWDNPDHRRARNGGFEAHVNDGVLAARAMSNIQCPCHFAVAASGGTWHGATLRLPPGRHAVFIAVGHQSLTEPRQRAAAVRESALAARERGVEKLQRSHRRWWRSFWQQSYVELPDKRLETMWFRSQYYLASFMPRRVAMFNVEGAYADFPAFAGGHPQDTAFHMFAAISSGHPDLCEGVLACLVEALPVIEATAKHAYFVRGGRIPWQATPGLLPYLEGHRNTPFSEHHQNACLVEAIRRYLELKNWPTRSTRRLYPIVRSVVRFWSSLLTPCDDGSFEMHYVPTLSQNEHYDSRDRRNVIDVLLSAKWGLRVAADMSRRLARDEQEARQWAHESDGIALHRLRLEDGSYAIHDQQTLETVIDGKVPAQLLGILLSPTMLDVDPQGWRKTLDRTLHTVDHRACAFSPGYYAIVAARMGDSRLALDSLQLAFDFSREPWVMFRENAPYGRMPYFLAAHALFVQGLNEMLIQTSPDGEPVLLPACPFENVTFQLPAGGQLLTIRKRGDHVERLNDPHN